MTSQTTNEKLLRQQWRTPRRLFELLDDEHHFQLDAAASADNALCAKYYTEADDSLSDNCPWVTEEHRRVFINPGFKNMWPWIEKACRERLKHTESVICIVGLCAPSTAWFRMAVDNGADVYLIGGSRLQFDPPPGIKKSSNARENAIFIFYGDEAFGRIVLWDWQNAKTRNECVHL